MSKVTSNTITFEDFKSFALAQYSIAFAIASFNVKGEIKCIRFIIALSLAFLK
jgi:hypothetical protein